MSVLSIQNLSKKGLEYKSYLFIFNIFFNIRISSVMSQICRALSAPCRVLNLIQNIEIYSAEFCDGDHSGHLLQLSGEHLSARTEVYLESRVMKSLSNAFMLICKYGS